MNANTLMILVWLVVVLVGSGIFYTKLIEMSSDVVESRLNEISDFIEIGNHTNADCFSLSRIFNAEYVGVTESQKERAEILLKQCPPTIIIEDFAP